MRILVIEDEPGLRGAIARSRAWAEDRCGLRILR